jgi:thioredoxin 1
MAEDEELERLREKKLQRLMKDTLDKEKNQTKPKSILNKPVEVTDSTFSEVIQNNSNVIIDCWAPWCAPCRVVSPIIDELAKEYAGKILFGKLNVDENQMITTHYGIMSIPTLLVFKTGKLVDRIIGSMPKNVLITRIQRYF